MPFEISAPIRQTPQQWREVVQPPGDEVVHFALTLPHAVDSQQPQALQFLALLRAGNPASVRTDVAAPVNGGGARRSPQWCR
jgi:hypothetical protein